MEAIAKWCAATGKPTKMQQAKVQQVGGQLASPPSRAWLVGLIIAVMLGVGLRPGRAMAESHPRAVGQISITSPVAAQEIYEVQSGDTLSAIAAAYGVTVAEIVEANELEDEDDLQVGQILVIPSGTTSEDSPDADNAATGEITPTVATSPAAPTATAQPLALPKPGGFASSLTLCADNSHAYRLNLPFDSIRVLVAHERLYFLANGDLFYLPLRDLSNQSTLSPISLMPAERRVGRYQIREFVYMTVEEASGDLVLLDKSNDIYRYNDAGWSMDFAAEQIPGQFPDQQYLAIRAIDGTVYALDSDLTHIWRLVPGNVLPSPYLPNGNLTTAIDLAMVNYGNSYLPVTLTRNGTLLSFAGGVSSGLFSADYDAGVAPWPAHILELDGALAIVEAQTRQVTAIDQENGQIIWTIDFRFPGMQRLRGVAMNDTTLFGIAGSTLYVAQLAALDDSCPRVTFDDTYYYDGLDLLAVTPNFQLPAPGELPLRPRSYPGARRLYRNGVHEGVDYYSTEAPSLGYGGAVGSVAAGVITRVDNNYVEMTPNEFDAAIAETERLHATTLELMDKFLGRQVHVQHNEFVTSAYAHLSGVATHLEVGTEVQAGETIGFVGVSGTGSGAYGSMNDVHLHFGIMVNGRYLGQGVSLYETWRLWDAVFSVPRPQRASSPTATPIVTPTVAPTVTATSGLLATVTPTPLPTALPTPVPTATPTLVATATANVIPRAPQRPTATVMPTGQANPSAPSAVAEPGGAIAPGSVACQRPPDDYTRVTIHEIPQYDPQTISARTLWMLELADTLYAGPGNPMAVVQGSYSDAVDASFGTHAGGGAVDISIRQKIDRSIVMTNEQAHELVIAMRQAGFAAWLRLPDDLSPPTTLHIHAIAVGDAELSPEAAAQLTGPQGYFRGWDGVPLTEGGSQPDRHGGPILCPWMEEMGYADLR